MTDIKELFDMVTKQTEPDLDSWKEQEDRQRKRSRQRRIGAFAVAAAFIVLAVIAVVSQRGGDEAGPLSGPSESPSGSTQITHSYLDIATGERSPVATALGGASLHEVSPNGEAIVYNTCCTSSDAIYVAALDGSDRVTVTPDTLDGYAATWIDDDTILFQGREAQSGSLGDLYVANVSTGEMTMVTDLPDDVRDESNTSWIVRSDVSPDGSTVLFHISRGKGNNEEWDLWTSPLAGGEATLLREDAGFAEYAPDGSIVFLDHPIPFESDEIWIMDGDGSNARSLVEGSALKWPKVSPDGTMVAYGHDGKAEIVDIATGDVTALDAFTEDLTWYGNDMLIVD